MTDAATWAVRPLSVRVPPGERRNPVALVQLAVGPLEMTLAVSRLRRSGLMVRPPLAEGGTPAIGAVPELWAEIEKTAIGAVAGDPATRDQVLGKLLKPRRRSSVASFPVAIQPAPASCPEIPGPAHRAAARGLVIEGAGRGRQRLKNRLGH